MKRLIFFGGTMGVGKMTTAQILKESLPNSVMLDGDWCWDMSPFQVTDETKAMVTDNICYLLNQFLRCSVFQNVIFCWVMDQQEIIDGLLSRLDLGEATVWSISLVCQPQALVRRLKKDIDQRKRVSDCILRSLARQPLYKELNTMKVDTTDSGPQAAAAEIISLISSPDP